MGELNTTLFRLMCVVMGVAFVSCFLPKENPPVEGGCAEANDTLEKGLGGGGGSSTDGDCVVVRADGVMTIEPNGLVFLLGEDTDTAIGGGVLDSAAVAAIFLNRPREDTFTMRRFARLSCDATWKLPPSAGPSYALGPPVSLRSS